MIFEDLTLEQLPAATKEQLVTTITKELASLDKKGLIEFICSNRGAPPRKNIFETLIKKEDSKNGQLLRVYEKTNVLGEKLGSTKIEWTYYSTGEVDTITTTELDALDQVISVKTLKHFRDGREPAFL